MDPFDTSQIQGWMQVITSTGFAGLVWYLIAYALPAIQKRFDETYEKSIMELSKQRDKDRELHERNNERILATHKDTVQEILDRHERQLDRMLGKCEPLRKP